MSFWAAILRNSRHKPLSAAESGEESTFMVVMPPAATLRNYESDPICGLSRRAPEDTPRTFKAGRGTCSGTVIVSVPHDQGKGKPVGDDGPLYDSTGE